MTHGYATQARCFHVKYTHRYILYTHTTMRYRCEILNHGIDGYEVWLHGRNQGRSGVNDLYKLCFQNYRASITSWCEGRGNQPSEQPSLQHLAVTVNTNICWPNFS